MPAADQEVDLAAVAGRYRLPGLGRVRLVDDSEGTFVQVGDALRFRVFPVGHGTLYVPGADAYLSVGPGTSGPPMLRWDSLFHRAEGYRLTARR